MAIIYYKDVIYSATMPTSSIGKIWIKQIGDGYQGYIYINDWIPFLSGGIAITETNNDNHKVNVVIQETQPNDVIKPGWIWIKESIEQAYLYIWDYVLITGA